jgi:universal stress protein E
MGKILIIADLEKKCFAIPRGLQIAAKLGHEVEVVAFIYAPLKAVRASAAQREGLRKRLLDERETEVRALIDKHLQTGQVASLTVVWEKNIHQWVNAQCANARYTMVVKTGHRSESLLHTSTDWQLLRECPAPVVLVAKKKWHKVKPVLAALDLASTKAAKKALNQKVLQQAMALAQALEVELEIIAAIEVPSVLAELDLVDPVTYALGVREAMRPRIAKLATEYGIPEAAFRCKRGAADKVIGSRAAEVRAQIVVMGTVARRGVKGLVIGNTAEKVLLRLRTDVMAMKL